VLSNQNMSDDDGDDTDDDRAGAGASDPVSTPSLDTVFDLLSDQRRRYVLYHLVNAADDTVDYEDLAEQVAVWEAGGDPSDEHVERVATDLYHSHLPKLTESNVVDFDQRSGDVRFWGQPTVEEYAEHAAMQELCDR
jgi:hypothetical protein